MRLLHWYDDLMNLYGEYGNIAVLKKHLEDLGEEVLVDKKSIGENVNINDYDFIYCGSGSESNLMVVLEDIKQYKEDLIKYSKADKVLLFTGNAMELFGEKINEREALSILPFTTEFSDKRYTGDVILTNEYFGEVVGFINKCSLIKGSEDKKLFDYLFKDNNLVDNDFEGYRYHNAFLTHVIGPILSKNPKVINYLVELLTNKKSSMTYEYEDKSYEVTINALKERMK